MKEKQFVFFNIFRGRQQLSEDSDIGLGKIEDLILCKWIFSPFSTSAQICELLIL